MKPCEIFGVSGAVGNNVNLAFRPVIVEGFGLRETADRGCNRRTVSKVGILRKAEKRGRHHGS